MPSAPAGATQWCEECQQYCGGTVRCDCCPAAAPVEEKLPAHLFTQVLHLPEDLGERVHDVILKPPDEDIDRWEGEGGG